MSGACASRSADCRSPVPEGGPQPERVLTVAPNPLVMVDGSFGFLNGANVTGVPDISAKVEALAPVRRHSRADARRWQRCCPPPVPRSCSPPQADPIPVDPRQGLIAPGLDPEGYLWSITADGERRAAGL